MAINLHSKYDGKTREVFTSDSFLAGRLCNDYDFSGVKTVKVSTIITAPMNDYKRTGTNRYGDPVNVGDTIQELTLTQDKGFSLVVDKGDNSEQNGIKNAGRVMKRQIKERAIPLLDTYGFNVLAHKAGKINASSTAITKSNVCERIMDATAYMDEMDVPSDNRTLFITPAIYKLLKLSPEFMANNELGKTVLAKGQVGLFDNMAVVKVLPSRFPANVNFMIVYKNSATLPLKLNDTKLHMDPPGISGHLLEGRQIYDCFVFGTGCDGVYVDVDTTSGKAKITADPVIDNSAGTITCSGAIIKYTTDGTDPRYSPNTKTYSVPITESGTTIRAYAVKDGQFPSSVVTAIKE